MREERGYVSLIVLSLVTVGALMFLVIYQLAVTGYGFVQDQSDRINEDVDLYSYRELVSMFMREDLYGDFNGDNLEEFLGGLEWMDDTEVYEQDESVRRLFKNYIYYVNSYEDENWVRFINYNTVIGDDGESRVYEMGSNFVGELANYNGYDDEEGIVDFPDKTYMKVVFGDDMTLGSTVTFDFVSDEGDYENTVVKDIAGEDEYIVEMGELPTSIEMIQIYSNEESLGNTAFELLYEREVGIDIHRIDARGNISENRVSSELIKKRIGVGHNKLVR